MRSGAVLGFQDPAAGRRRQRNAARRPRRSSGRQVFVGPDRAAAVNLPWCHEPADRLVPLVLLRRQHGRWFRGHAGPRTRRRGAVRSRCPGHPPRGRHGGFALLPGFRNQGVHRVPLDGGGMAAGRTDRQPRRSAWRPLRSEDAPQTRGAGMQRCLRARRDTHRHPRPMICSVATTAPRASGAVGPEPPRRADEPRRPRRVRMPEGDGRGQAGKPARTHGHAPAGRRTPERGVRRG